MAKRAYKKNRARGTRKSTYREKVVAGFVVPKITGKSTKQYVEEFVRKNILQLQQTYTKEYETFEKLGAEGRFLQQNPDVKSYVEHLLVDDKKLTRKKVLFLIEERLAPLSWSQAKHVLDQVKADPDFYEALKLKAGEELRVEGFSYLGDNVFSYRTTTGKVIKFAFIAYGSNAKLEFFDED